MLQSLYASAQESGNYGDIFSFLDSHTSPAAFSDLYEGSRWFMFNMSNLKKLPTASGTVEFRSAPASPDTETAIHWATWVLSFIANAIGTDWSSTTGPGVRGVGCYQVL